MRHDPDLSHRRSVRLPGYDSAAAGRSATTKRIKAARGRPGTPVRQRTYDEHVILNDDDDARISNDIMTNPPRGALDHENPTRLSDDEFDAREKANALSGRRRAGRMPV